MAVADRDTSGIEADIRLPGDLTDAAEADRLPAATLAALGGLHMLFNNAGLTRRGHVTETSDDDLRSLLAVDVEAPFRLSRGGADHGAGGPRRLRRLHARAPRAIRRSAGTAQRIIA